MISHSPNNTSHSHSSSIRLMSSPVVCLSLCRRVVLAPIYLCFLLNMFAPSHSQPLLHTQKTPAIETTSISILRHLYPYRYQHLPLFVLHCIHMCMNLLSVHVAPISLSVLDVLATAFQLYETYAYADHTDIDIWRCIYEYILPIIITLTSSLSVSPLPICFSLLPSSSIRVMSSPVVCMSVCKRVVLAPIHLCSLLNMFAPSRPQPLLHTQKITANGSISIATISSLLKHLYPYQSQHLPLFVLYIMHICMDLLSVHVALIMLSLLDMLATAFQLHDTYAYADHTDIDIWRCIYRYIPHIILTLTSLLLVPALSVCFNVRFCSVIWLLVMSMTWFLCSFLSVISVFFIAIVCLIVLSSKLASFLSISTIHQSILVTVLALILVSILDFIAALSKKQLVDRRKPHISCLHSIILSCDNVLQPCVWMRG
jgi:hypothetical protein